MRPILRLLAALTVLIATSLAMAAPAAAVPTVTFSVGSFGLKVGEPATYTADALCDVEPCRYQWRWYRILGNDRLGTTMGEGPELTYAFSTSGLKRVVLKVTNATRAHGFAVSSQVLRVMPDGDAPVDPQPTDPVDPPVDPVDPPVDPLDPPPFDPVDPPVDDPTPPADVPNTAAADPSTTPISDPAAPPVGSNCPLAVSPVPDPATTCTPPVPTVDPPTEPPVSFGDDPTADPVIAVGQ